MLELSVGAREGDEVIYFYFPSPNQDHQADCTVPKKAQPAESALNVSVPARARQQGLLLRTATPRPWAQLQPLLSEGAANEAGVQYH